MKNRKITRNIKISAIILCPLFFIIGIYLDWQGFIGNLAAGGIEILITITVIDRLLERERRERWEKAREQIFSALTQHIYNLMCEYQIHFHSPKLELTGCTSRESAKGLYTAHRATADALKCIVKNMEEAPRPSNSREQAERTYKAIQWDINQILMSLLPRIIEIEHNELTLVNLLSEFDNANRNWVNQKIMDKEVGAGDQYKAAIELLKQATNIYLHLLKNA